MKAGLLNPGDESAESLREAFFGPCCATWFGDTPRSRCSEKHCRNCRRSVRSSWPKTSIFTACSGSVKRARAVFLSILRKRMVRETYFECEKTSTLPTSAGIITINNHTCMRMSKLRPTILPGNLSCVNVRECLSKTVSRSPHPAAFVQASWVDALVTMA